MSYRTLVNNKSAIATLGTTLAVIMVLFYLSRINYLLFHSIAEIFSIVISSAVFVISWNSRDNIENSLLVHLGIAYLFIGIIDLFHTLSYVGMNIFTDYDYYANQLWIGARYMESVTLLIFFILTGSKFKISFATVFVGYSALTTFLLLSVFDWKIFPVCYIAEQGLTPFKVISEYIISSFLVASLIMLYRKRRHFDAAILKLLAWAIVFTIFSELAFTLYISNYGISNLVGHYLKIGSFYFVYKALIETGLRRPMAFLLKEIKQHEKELERSEQKLKIANLNLKIEIAEKQRVEEKIKENLKEKETLLKEIHHRVKNNMTVISSLLSLQMSNMDDQKAKEALLDSQNRVQTMAKIHEALYRSDSLAAIKMQDYLTELGNIVLQGYVLSNQVDLIVNAENVMMESKQASSIGLVVNELITNSLKYAFPDNSKGIITVNLQKNNDDFELMVSDNGIGIKENIDIHNTNSIGLKLVKTLAENQLAGSLDIKNEAGLKVTARFSALPQFE